MEDETKQPSCTSDTESSIFYMEQYIKALVENVDKQSLPQKMNVIFATKKYPS